MAQVAGTLSAVTVVMTAVGIGVKLLGDLKDLSDYNEKYVKKRTGDRVVNSIDKVITCVAEHEAEKREREFREVLRQVNERVDADERSVRELQNEIDAELTDPLSDEHTTGISVTDTIEEEEVVLSTGTGEHDGQKVQIEINSAEAMAGFVYDKISQPIENKRRMRELVEKSPTTYKTVYEKLLVLSILSGVVIILLIFVVSGSFTSGNVSDIFLGGPLLMMGFLMTALVCWVLHTSLENEIKDIKSKYQFEENHDQADAGSE